MPEFTLQDTANALETRIRQYRPLDVPITWANELIFPHFDGLSIANLAQSIMQILGADVGSPLDDTVWGGTLPQDIDRIVLFLSDGMGYKYLNQLVNDNVSIKADVHAISAGRGFIPLTSITPSTTVAALTTFWTGVPPGQHGVVGTHMFLKEVSMLCNFLFFKPSVGQHRNGILEDWGLDASTFVTVPSLASQLQSVGVETHLLMNKPLIGSGLSKILHRGVAHNHSHRSTSDMWVRLREVLKQTRGTKSYVSVYLDHIDRLSHEYGAHNSYTQTEIATQLQYLREILQDATVQDGRTLFLFVADHGHYDTPNRVSITDDPRLSILRDAMRYDFGSEARLGTFSLRNGTKLSVIAHLQDTFADTLAVLDVEEMIDSGIFGMDNFHPHLRHRLGDIVITPKLGTVIVDEQHKFGSMSRHGGLSDWEMLVPMFWSQI